MSQKKLITAEKKQVEIQKETTCRVNLAIYKQFIVVCEKRCMKPKALVNLLLKEWSKRNDFERSEEIINQVIG